MTEEVKIVRCLAFDQSTTKTGIVLMDGLPHIGQRKVLFAATIVSTIYGEFRDQFIKCGITRELSGLVNRVAYEGAYIHPSGKKSPLPAFAIMRAAGWIEAIVWEYLSQSSFFSATARVWRNHVWGDGAGAWVPVVAKPHAIKYAMSFNIENPDDHMGDACGIASWAIDQ